MKGALGGWSGGGQMHTQCSPVDTGALGGRATVPAHQCRQPVDFCSAGLQPPVQSSSRGSTINCTLETAAARHQAPSSARLTGVGQLTTLRSFLNDADHWASWPPHPATQASLPDTCAWTIARNCPVSQVYTPMALHSLPSVSC